MASRTSASAPLFSENPEAHFQRGFERIAATRMAGLPLSNPNLSVRALDFVRAKSLWLGALVTPWSIFAVLVPADETGAEALAARPGESIVVTLPAGDFAFLGAEEPGLGSFLLCSLLSPVFEIPNQEVAQGIALESLRLMREGLPEMPEEEGTPLASSPAPDTDNRGKRVIPIRDVHETPEPTRTSRRAFLTRYFQ